MGTLKGEASLVKTPTKSRSKNAGSRKSGALAALKEIRQAVKRSGISEEELHKTGCRVRRKLAKERYGPQP